MRLDATALKAAHTRLRDAQLYLDTTLDAVERGWAGDQLDRIYNCINSARKSMLSARRMLENGQRRDIRRRKERR